MRKWIEVTAKTVDDAITEALIKLGSTRDKVDIEVIEKESSGFLGLNKRPARIRAAVQETLQDKAVYFLEDVFKLMEIQSEIAVNYNGGGTRNDSFTCVDLRRYRLYLVR